MKGTFRFRVWGVGFSVWDSELRAWDLWFRFGVHALGFRA